MQEVADKLDFREFYSIYLGAIHAALKPKTGGNFQILVEICRDGIAAGSQTETNSKEQFKHELFNFIRYQT